MKKYNPLLIAALLTFLPALALGLGVEKPLKNPEQEARAQALFKELRCMVCQSQSIADSNADLARDMRAVVREKISKGQKNQEIKAYLVSRYGNYALMTPPFNLSTLLLWCGPLLLFLGGGTLVYFYFRAGGRQK